jgi:hypothetical protein
LGPASCELRRGKEDLGSAVHCLSPRRNEASVIGADVPSQRRSLQ